MGTAARIRPPPRGAPPKTPDEILRDIHRRIVRIETRQGRILERLGLDSRGDPLPNPRIEG